jgi:hypothetical protein
LRRRLAICSLHRKSGAFLELDSSQKYGAFLPQ